MIIGMKTCTRNVGTLKSAKPSFEAPLLISFRVGINSQAEKPISKNAKIVDARSIGLSLNNFYKTG